MRSVRLLQILSPPPSQGCLYEACPAIQAGLEIQSLGSVFSWRCAWHARKEHPAQVTNVCMCTLKAYALHNFETDGRAVKC